MQTIETRCPVFTGFYGTIWEMDTESEIDSYNQEHNVNANYDSFDWDNSGYEKAVCKKFVSLIEPKLKEIFPAIKSIKFKNEWSPREYNYVNDHIIIDVTFTKKLHSQIRNYLDDNGTWLKYIQDHYTSRSGFISHYGKDLDWWIDKTDNYNDLSDYLVLYSIFDSALSDLVELDDFYYEVMESVYVSEYAEYKGNECTECMNRTENKHGFCDECIENDPDLKKQAEDFNQKLIDHRALQHTPTFTGIDLIPVEPIFSPIL